MNPRTLKQLEAAIEAFARDLSPRVAELAAKSTAGTLTDEGRAEYERIVQLNDLISTLKLEADDYWTNRIAS